MVLGSKLLETIAFTPDLNALEMFQKSKELSSVTDIVAQVKGQNHALGVFADKPLTSARSQPDNSTSHFDPRNTRVLFRINLCNSLSYPLFFYREKEGDDIYRINPPVISFNHFYYYFFQFETYL